jgi:lipid-binding SYLF domain-containing protein
MNRTLLAVALVAAMGFGLVGCSTAPKDQEKRDALDSDTQKTLAAMKSADPTFGAFLDSSYGYAVFPTVGKGGLIVGGSYGKGEVMEQGKFVGYSDMTQATIGAQIGGESFAEVICFENKQALDQFTAKEYAFTAQVQAVALKSGAAKNARFREGLAVFTYIKGGLMAEAAVGGQKFRFVSMK